MAEEFSVAGKPQGGGPLEASGRAGRAPGSSSSLTAALWWLAIGINLAALIYPVLWHRGLFADGAYHLLTALSTSTIHHDEVRRGALYLLQGPMIALVSGLGLRSVRVASWVYVGSLLLMPWLLLLATVLFLPAQRRVLAFFPVLSLLVSYFLASLFAVSEAFIASSLWWAVLLYLIGDDLKARSWVASLACLLLTLLMVYSYEPLAMFAVLLLVLLLFKYATARDREHVMRLSQRLILALMGLALLTAFVVGIRWTLFPVNEARQHALSAGVPLGELVTTYPVQLCAAASVVGLLTLRSPFACRPPRWQQVRWGIWLAFAATFLILGQWFPVVVPRAQFDGRLLIPLSVIGFSAGAVVASIRLDRDPSFARELTAWLAPMALCLSILHVWWQFETTWTWQDYLSAISAARRPGEVFDATKQFQSNPFTWTWAVASLSIVTIAMQSSIIDGIVFADTAGWKPFDPRCPGTWPSLQRLGVQYHVNRVDCP